MRWLLSLQHSPSSEDLLACLAVSGTSDGLWLECLHVTFPCLTAQLPHNVAAGCKTERSNRPGRSCIAFYDSAPEVTWSHFSLYSQSYLNSRGGDTDPSPPWRCVDIHCKKSMWDGYTDATILENTIHARWAKAIPSPGCVCSQVFQQVVAWLAGHLDGGG